MKNIMITAELCLRKYFKNCFQNGVLPISKPTDERLKSCFEVNNYKIF